MTTQSSGSTSLTYNLPFKPVHEHASNLPYRDFSGLNHDVPELSGIYIFHCSRIAYQMMNEILWLQHGVDPVVHFHMSML